MTTQETCNLEPFRYQTVSQPDLASGASSNQINEQSLEDYLARFREAVCADVNWILENCCDGGGGGGGVTTFLELTDVAETSYSGEGGNAVIVNPGEDALIFGTPAAGTDSDGLFLDLSTSEQTTNRDDQSAGTIYQKTVLNAGNLSTGVTNIAHGITGLADVLALHCWVDRSNGSQMPFPFASGGSTFAVSLQVDGTNVIVNVGTGWTGAGLVLSNLRCTMFYTK